MSTSDRTSKQSTIMSANLEQPSNEKPAIQPKKPKPAAKSMVTLDIKPWGTSNPQTREIFRYSHR